jgi:hypothetical protein
VTIDATVTPGGTTDEITPHAVAPPRGATVRPIELKSNSIQQELLLTPQYLTTIFDRTPKYLTKILTSERISFLEKQT